MRARWARELCPGFGRGFSTAGCFCGSAVSLGALGLAGCASSDDLLRAEAAKVYGEADEKFPIPAVDVSKMDPKYFSQARALRQQ